VIGANECSQQTGSFKNDEEDNNDRSFFRVALAAFFLLFYFIPPNGNNDCPYQAGKKNTAIATSVQKQSGS